MWRLCPRLRVHTRCRRLSQQMRSLQIQLTSNACGCAAFVALATLLLGGMPHKTMLGTSFAAQIGPGLSGAWAHHRLGNLRLDLVPALVCGSAIGSAAASTAAVGLPEEQLRLAFSTFVVGLGLHALRAATRMPMPHGVR